MISIYKYNKQRENSPCFCKGSQRLELMSVTSLFQCSFHIFLALNQNLSWSVFTWWNKQNFISKGLNPKWVRTLKILGSHVSAPKVHPLQRRLLETTQQGIDIAFRRGENATGVITPVILAIWSWLTYTFCTCLSSASHLPFHLIGWLYAHPTYGKVCQTNPADDKKLRYIVIWCANH